MEIDANNEVIEGSEVVRSALQEEYDELQAEVTVFQEQIDCLDEEIDALQEQVDIANQELDDKYEVYCRRIREIRSTTPHPTGLSSSRPPTLRTSSAGWTMWRKSSAMMRTP